MDGEFESKKGIYPGYKPNPPREKGDEFTKADFDRLMGFVRLLKRADDKNKARLKKNGKKSA